MKYSWGAERGRRVALFCLGVVMMCGRFVHAQNASYERTFPQQKAIVEKILQQLQSSASGRLPLLDGFARPGDRPLDRYSRGYYQCSTTVNSTSAGGSLVKVSAKITAWYADIASGKSGYQEMISNGRLENDFLDRIAEALAAPPIAGAASSGASLPKNQTTTQMPTAPEPVDSSSPFKTGNASDHAPSPTTQKVVTDKHADELTAQAKSLAEILHNQAHPTNLVAVRKAGTPILVNPTEGAKVLFLADAEDEFEILDMNVNWVHVRISGLSRGWIRRSSLELPEAALRDTPAPSEPQPTSSVPFQVKDEQISTFPGAWEPLRGKTVRILTVQETIASHSDTGPSAKLDFAKSLFEKEYSELAQTPTTAAGVVLIFDSKDGGMMAAPLATIQEWKAGSLSDQAFWRRCFLDPPEMLNP